MTVSTIVLRRSAGFSVLLIAIAVMAGQIAFRSHGWIREWTWATYETGFDTVLLAPVVAAAGALEGHRLAQARAELATVPQAWRTSAAGCLGVSAWAAVVYVAGVCAVWTVVLIHGTPGNPSLRDVLTILPPVGFLAAAAGAGIAIGRHLGRLLSVSLAAVCWFAATLYFYSVGPAQFVTVGGASGSLVALHPRVEVQLIQIGFFVAIALACLALASRRRDTSARRRWVGVVPIAATLVLVLCFGALLSTKGKTLLERASEQTRCSLTGPEICAALGYTQDARSARAALAPYVLAMRAAGVQDVPTRFDQTALPGGVTVGPLSNSFLNGRHSEAETLVVAAYVSKACAVLTDSKMQISWTVLHWYLLTTVDGQSIEDPALPTELTQGNAEQQHQVVQEAAAYLAACSRTLGAK